jgi:hypothetical protein
MPQEKSIEFLVEVCCHDVELRYWGFEAEIDEDLKAALQEQGEERAKKCISDGFSSGELNSLYNDEEIRGWWEICPNT